jgi:rubrerythrin
MQRSKFEEILSMAIEKEQEAVDAYTAAAGTVKRANIRDMLLDLARQEQGHKRRLMAIDMAGIPDAHVRDIPDLKIAEYADDVGFSASMDYQDVLTVAMKREEAARDLYRHLASISEESELRGLFDLLAQEEARHKLLLEKEYDEHVLTDN